MLMMLIWMNRTHTGQHYHERMTGYERVMTMCDRQQQTSQCVTMQHNPHVPGQCPPLPRVTAPAVPGIVTNIVTHHRDSEPSGVCFLPSHLSSSLCIPLSCHAAYLNCYLESQRETSNK